MFTFTLQNTTSVDQSVKKPPGLRVTTYDPPHVHGDHKVGEENVNNLNFSEEIQVTTRHFYRRPITSTTHEDRSVRFLIVFPLSITDHDHSIEKTIYVFAHLNLIVIYRLGNRRPSVQRSMAGDGDTFWLLQLSIDDYNDDGSRETSAICQYRDRAPSISAMANQVQRRAKFNGRFVFI